MGFCVLDSRADAIRRLMDAVSSSCFTQGKTLDELTENIKAASFWAAVRP
jgi:hypothetical protein